MYPATKPLINNNRLQRTKWTSWRKWVKPCMERYHVSQTKQG